MTEDTHKSANAPVCTSCGAKWQNGEFGLNCEECGGGALQIACIVCTGRCGSQWKRMVMDSQDSGIAHWIGGCLLPDEEKRRCIQEQIQPGSNGLQ
jgi:hypothetical protein